MVRVLLTSLALVVGGVAIVLIGRYFWNHPEQYYRYLHGASVWAALNVRPPSGAVKMGAAITVVVGVGVTCWGLVRFVASV
jgi:hypothetical protein